MYESWRGVLLLLGFALIALLAFLGARHWQSTQPGYTRITMVNGCDLHAGPCEAALGEGRVTLAMGPSGIALMKPLGLSVVTAGLVAVRSVVVEIRGLNMDMGLNRTVLARTADGRWEGETILPICSQRRMEWEAAVQIETDGRYELPFPFHTTRP